MAFYSYVYTLGCSRILPVEHMILDMKAGGDVSEEKQIPFSQEIGSQTMALITLVEWWRTKSLYSLWVAWMNYYLLNLLITK